MYNLRLKFLIPVFLFLGLWLPSSGQCQEIDTLFFPRWVSSIDFDTNQINLELKVLTGIPTGAEFHWQIRVVQIPESGQRTMAKFSGVCNLNNTVTTIQKIKHDINPGENLLVYAFLLDRDFVIDQLIWDLAEQNLPKALQQKLPEKRLTRSHLAPDGFDLGGLVFNETRTRFGREFFSIFQQNWRPPTQTDAWWITIREFPTPGRFTLISVSLNNKELFQRFLLPRRDQMEELVVYTVQTLQELLSQGAIEGLFSEEDLHGKTIETVDIERF